jgi:uncharacterized protein YeaO (DUF488 family)
MPDLGPSAELHAAAYGKGRSPLQWSGYRSAYLLEMRKQRPAIQDLAKRVAKGETLTLLCSSACEQESRCHRSLLKALIEAEVQALQHKTGESGEDRHGITGEEC